MGRKMSTYHSEMGKGYCEVHMDFKEEMAYIKYFDDHDRQFYREEFPNKAIGYVTDAAINWCLGIKKLVDI